MGIRKIGCLLAVCLMVFMSRAYAENMQFVDANGSTGYYVDTDSISSDQVVENDVQKTLWTARVAVIRADLNRRYIYLMQFDQAVNDKEIKRACPSGGRLFLQKRQKKRRSRVQKQENI